MFNHENIAVNTYTKIFHFSGNESLQILHRKYNIDAGGYQWFRGSTSRIASEVSRISKELEEAMGGRGDSEIMYEALGAINLLWDVLDRVDWILYRKEPEAREEKGMRKRTPGPKTLVPKNETLAAASSNALNCHLKKESSLCRTASNSSIHTLQR